MTMGVCFFNILAKLERISMGKGYDGNSGEGKRNYEPRANAGRGQDKNEIQNTSKTERKKHRL